MGNKIQSPLVGLEANLIADIHHSRLVKADIETTKGVSFPNCISIPEFKRMEDWQVELQGIKPPEQLNLLTLSSLVCFREKESMDAYLSSLLSLKQICNISVFHQILMKTEANDIQCIITSQSLPERYEPIQKSLLSGIHLNNFMDLLIFITQATSQVADMYIPPEEIYHCNGQFYLRSFYFKKHKPNKLLLTYIAWLYEEFESFNDLFENQHVISFVEMDIYLREVYLALKAEKVSSRYMTLYLTRVKAKYNYLNFNFDSFQACCRSKKSKCYSLANSEWLLAKKVNEIYFFNIKDRHMCQGRVIRKKTKINVEEVHTIFNLEELQINFMLQGTKNMVKTSEFQLEDSFTISDIEIKFKFPFKMKNPMMFKRGKEIFLFDQMVYRYAIDENKLYQESKRINDGICLAQSSIHNYMVVRLSTDIFRHGIRIYYDDKYDTVYPSGNPSLATEIEHIKIDLKHIEFCLEIYKGVYLLLASHNFWIIDLNFNCFFSYTPIQRVKQYFKNKNSLQKQSDFCFEILDQPFSVKWLPHQDNLNVSIQGDRLHTIGSVMGKLFYLQYQFILQAGLLKLKDFQPLFNDEPKASQIVQTPEPKASQIVQTPEPKASQIVQISEASSSQKREFSFKIYSEHFDSFKSSKWIYQGPSFLQVYSLRSISSKTHTEILLQTEPVLINLKEIIDQNRRVNRRWPKSQLAMLLHSVFTIFNEINKQNISHKHFNVSNLWITHQKKIKLIGWSEPHRNWYISDYRDFLLTCFNIITLNNSQKITDKLMEKHDEELSQFPALKDKMNSSLKYKLPEKKPDQQKYMVSIRESLHKSISPLFEKYTSGNFIFSFEFNTPRFSMLNIAENKIKKMSAVLEGGHTNNQFTFKPSDQYAWNQHQQKLYIFTTNYQMLQAAVSVKQLKQQTIVLEEYQYLPKNIVQCSFISTPQGLFAFGGIALYSKKNVLYNVDIYHFDQQKLTWVPVATLPSPRMQPRITLSVSGTHVFLMGGELHSAPDHLSTLKFNLLTNEIESLIDYGLQNPLRSIQAKQTNAMFQVAQQESIFLLWVANATQYSFKIFSNLVCGLEIQLEGKIYLQDGGELPSVSIAMADGAIHFLRPYGKYTKISLGSLQTVSVTHKTLYSN